MTSSSSPPPFSLYVVLCAIRSSWSHGGSRSYVKRRALARSPHNALTLAVNLVGESRLSAAAFNGSWRLGPGPATLVAVISRWMWRPAAAAADFHQMRTWINVGLIRRSSLRAHRRPMIHRQLSLLPSTGWEISSRMIYRLSGRTPTPRSTCEYTLYATVSGPVLF